MLNVNFNFFSVPSVFSVVNLAPVFHIARGAHGVLNKNKNFISWIFNNLSQKISCGQGVIFARRAHFHAKGRQIVRLGGVAMKN